MAITDDCENKNTVAKKEKERERKRKREREKEREKERERGANTWSCWNSPSELPSPPGEKSL